MEAGMDKYAKDAATGKPIAPAAEPPAAVPAPAERPGASNQPSGDSHTPEVPTPGSESPPGPGETSPPESQPAAESTTGNGKGKISPWKLVDEYKGKLATAEKQIADIRASVVPEQERAALTERVTKAEQRAQQLEDRIRYVDYESSTEFQNKFHKPYESAFARAMSDLRDINVPVPDGNPRAFTADDLAQLVTMDRATARKTAEELFGADANDVLNARAEVRRLWDERNAGLEEAKKTLGSTVEERRRQLRAAQEAISKTTKQTWDQVNAGLLNDPTVGEYFKPKEGNQEWNQRLAKGFELVDRAFAEDPRDPRLTPDQRAAIIKRHAAVRNRAASWGALRYSDAQKDIKIAALEKQLSGYKSSTPPATGTQPAPNGAPAPLTGKRMDRMLSGMDKYGKAM
jgi:hypothetical protein